MKIREMVKDLGASSSIAQWKLAELHKRRASNLSPAHTSSVTLLPFEGVQVDTLMTADKF